MVFAAFCVDANCVKQQQQQNDNASNAKVGKCNKKTRKRGIKEINYILRDNKRVVCF